MSGIHRPHSIFLFQPYFKNTLGHKHHKIIYKKNSIDQIMIHKYTLDETRRIRFMPLWYCTYTKFVQRMSNPSLITLFTFIFTIRFLFVRVFGSGFLYSTCSSIQYIVHSNCAWHFHLLLLRWNLIVPSKKSVKRMAWKDEQKHYLTAVLPATTRRTLVCWQLWGQLL